MNFKQIDEKLKEKLAPINLSRRLPGYICKPIFIFSFLIVVFIASTALLIEGPSVTLSCDSVMPCANPLYPCPVHTTDKPCQMPGKKGTYICPDDICKIDILPAGYVYEKKNSGIELLKRSLLRIILFTLLLNHIVFMLRHRKMLPEWRGSQ